MKKLGLLVGAMVAALSIAAGTATVSAYPPGGATLALSASTVAPGASFTATFTGCQLGETVNFVLDGTSVAAACNGPAGSRRLPSATGEPVAIATLTAPTTLGTYDVVATGETSGATATASLTVVAAAPGDGGALPETGSDGAPTMQIAGGLVVVGAGLAGVAGVRRRKSAHAA